MSDWRVRRGRNPHVRVAAICFTATLLFCLASARLGHAQGKAWGGVLDLPTYEEGAADPNPPFDPFATTRFHYPNTLRNELTNKRTDSRTSTSSVPCCRISAVMSAPALAKSVGSRCSTRILPSKKPGPVFRGAWAAFGIGFSFPVSHNWVSAGSRWPARHRTEAARLRLRYIAACKTS
jgi:hypothetical protein